MGCTAGKNEEHKIARWYTNVLPRRGGHIPKMTESRTRYLPLEIKGCCVLKEVSQNKYRVDNSELKDRAHGVCYRLSKSVDDKDPEHVAYWGSVVIGRPAGDGWLCCDLDEEGMELLERLEKENPIETLKRCGHKGRLMVSGSTSSNVDGRWVARGHTGTKVIDGDMVQYGLGLSTTMAWEGLNSFSIDVMGERRRARLIDDTLVWNDGDVWTRDGRTRHSNMKPVDTYGDSELEAGTAMMPPFTAFCQKGLKPNSPNQDAWSVVRVEDDFSIYSVYDGHGPHGHDVANFVKDTLPRLLVSRLTEAADLREMFTETYRRMHLLIDSADAYDKLSARWSGCTSTTVVHHHQTGRLSLAHVGDSSAVLGGWDGAKTYAKQLTRDHKPQLKDEMARIIASGGLIDFDGYSDYRIYNKDGYGAGLNMTRSLGDLEAHRETGLIADPEISEHQVGTHDRVLLLCGDGIWEFMKPEEAVDIALKFSDPREAAQALVKDARQRWSLQAEYIDDIVVLVIPLSTSKSPRRSPVNKASSGGA